MKGYLNYNKKFELSEFSIQCRLYWSGKLGGRKTSQCFRKEMVMAWIKQGWGFGGTRKREVNELKKNVDGIESTVVDWLVEEVKGKVHFFYLATGWKGGKRPRRDEDVWHLGWRRGKLWMWYLDIPSLKHLLRCSRDVSWWLDLQIWRSEKINIKDIKLWIIYMWVFFKNYMGINEIV